MSRKKHHKHKTGKGKATQHHQQHLLSKGTLEITRSGIGYVVIADGSGDVLVRPGDFNNALHGDTVRVKVIRENLRSGRKEGRITEVVSRKQTEFIGTLQMAANFAFVVVDGERPMPDIYVPLDRINGAKNKDKVVVRMIKWDKDDKKPVGEVVTTMDATNENDLAMKEILASNGFSLSFPDEVMEEAERLPDSISQSDIDKRKDFRDVLTFTIDPVDAKDFDDALSLRLLPNGWYEIGVHIADVSHYVEPGSALDDEAYRRATSVYMPDRVNPMLPERISNELCSLRPHEDKMSFSAVFQMNKNAEVKEFWIGKTVIHSNHRFTYEDVQEIIESGEGKYLDEIFLLNNLAQTMRRERFAKGAINFSSQEVRFKLDENAKPIGIVVKESKEAHQLIEEFMLLANRTVAAYVSRIKVGGNDLPFPYRVHDQPDEQKLTPFIAFARKYGHTFDISTPEKIAESFNRMLEAAKGKPEQHVLEQLGIRTMAKAVYTSQNIGHYGLGFEDYCHFTSPIRRYPDVMVHRIVETCLAGKPEVDKKMEEKCKHSSERERAAMECERSGNKYKQVEYMKSYLGEEFEAVISGVSGFGFWAETVAHKCEGLVHITSLSDYDDFRHNEADYSLDGLRSGRRFRMGDKVRIRVVAANLEKRQLDYEWVLHATEEATVTPQATVASPPAKYIASRPSPAQPKTEEARPAAQQTAEPGDPENIPQTENAAPAPEHTAEAKDAAIAPEANAAASEINAAAPEAKAAAPAANAAASKAKATAPAANAAVSKANAAASKANAVPAPKKAAPAKTAPQNKAKAITPSGEAKTASSAPGMSKKATPAKASSAAAGKPSASGKAITAKPVKETAINKPVKAAPEKASAKERPAKTNPKKASAKEQPAKTQQPTAVKSVAPKKAVAKTKQAAPVKKVTGTNTTSRKAAVTGKSSVAVKASGGNVKATGKATKTGNTKTTGKAAKTTKTAKPVAPVKTTTVKKPAVSGNATKVGKPVAPVKKVAVNKPTVPAKTAAANNTAANKTAANKTAPGKTTTGKATKKAAVPNKPAAPGKTGNNSKAKSAKPKQVTGGTAKTVASKTPAKKKAAAPVKKRKK
ncbi:ribonuclease R [Filimonas effusa]|uniref:Ribonuclease R n=1 Tax=Filimonas effusa TaxID=2508721 RepID=A0A4Q1DBH5_9BACT|nr:ribonuclease R [Filimonas effusa]RXK86268.1 ribonuclease R [Filimonas effusa]